jgi:hypothetical protein
VPRVPDANVRTTCILHHELHVAFRKHFVVRHAHGEEARNVYALGDVPDVLYDA